MTKFGYFFAKSTYCTRYVTIAITRPAKDDPNQQHFAAFSFCSSKDLFNKKLGRRVAEGRLVARKGLEFNFTGTIDEVIQAAMKLAIDQGIVPEWVIRANKQNKLQYGLHTTSMTRGQALDWLAAHPLECLKNEFGDLVRWEAHAAGVRISMDKGHSWHPDETWLKCNRFQVTEKTALEVEVAV